MFFVETFAFLLNYSVKIMTSLAERKGYLINKIAAVHSENEIAEWEKIAQYMQEKKDFIQTFTKPLASNISLEELAVEKSYKGISKEDWGLFRENINIEEPLDQLLESIKS